MQKKIVLFPKRLCRTQSGDLAHTIGRLAFQPGSPMLVEHLNGVYLTHDLKGRVLTRGYGDDYAIIRLYGEEEMIAASRRIYSPFFSRSF